MYSIFSTPASRMVLAGLATGAFMLVAGGAQAQVPGCDKIKSLNEHQQSIIAVINKKTAGGKKLTAPEACGLFGQLANSSAETLKWVESNKAWCQIPDQFINSVKEGNVKVSKIRAQACKVAAQQKAMTQRAQGGGGMPLDDGLSGNVRIPQGAL